MIEKEYEDKEFENMMNGLFDDEMDVFVMAGGRFRGALFHGTRFVNRMRLQHSLGILETQVLGQACLSGALLIPTMKGRENLTFRYDTNGPAAGFCVNADSSGFVRGYLLQNPIPIDKPLESWDLAPFFGEGTLSVSRLPEGAKEYSTGTVEIRHRNIAQDLAWYFEQSEQTRTAFNTSIMMDGKGRVIGAGGMFLQKMPDFGGKLGGMDGSGKLGGRNCDEKVGGKVGSESDGRAAENEFSSMDDDELLERVEHAFSSCPSLGQWFSEKGNLEDIVYGLFRDFKPSVAVKRKIRFDCPCSKESFINHIRALNKEELADIKKNGPDPLEIVCHNCGSVYRIGTDEL